MASSLKRGQIVSHPGFGPGVVKSVLDGGRRVRVEFDKLPGIPYTLPATQFEASTPVPEPEAAEEGSSPLASPASEKAGSGLPNQPSPASMSPISSDDRADPKPAKAKRRPKSRPLQTQESGAGRSGATGRSRGSTENVEKARRPASTRQLFEALRMGVVPPAGLDRYTVGRDREIRRLRALIEGRRGLVVIEGHYGTGKTHMIELAQAEAREAGYLTSRVSFDAVEVPPSNPLRVYREVVANLCYPPEGVPGGGLSPLLEGLIPSRRHRQPGTVSFHRYLSLALFAKAEGTAEAWELVQTFVEGRGGSNAEEARRVLRLSGWRGPQMLALPDYRTFGQVFLYLVGGIATWARDAGFQGLAVFFDEAEAFDTLERTSREFAETVLRYFAAATLPESGLPFKVRDLYRGGQSVHRGLPHVFQADQPLLACFAFTPLPEVARAIEGAGIGPRRVLELEPLALGLMPELARRLVGLYRELHPATPLAPEIVTRLTEHIEGGLRAGVLTTTRAVTRLTVEYLDLVRHLPDQAGDALVEL